MVTFIYDGKKEEVDLTKVSFRQNKVNKATLEGRLRRFADNLSLGKLCVVQEKHIIASSSYTGISLFRVGKGGLIARKAGQKEVLGIDVMIETHPFLRAREASVLRVNLPTEFRQGADFVNLSLGGVSTHTSWNEGTFSPSGGWEVHTQIGSYVNAIYLGEKQITKVYPVEVEEFKLRSRSVPFILPSQYLYIANGPFGDISEAATTAMINLFTREGSIDKPMTRDERDEVRRKAEEYSTKRGSCSQSRRNWTKTMNRLDRDELLWKNIQRLTKEGSNQTKIAIMQNVTLSAVGEAIRKELGASRGFYRDSSGNYELWEINEGYVHDEKKGSVKMPRRGFELVPSKLMFGTVYVFPKNDYSAQCLSDRLVDFNSEYPDTLHIDSAKQNHPLASVVKR